MLKFGDKIIYIEGVLVEIRDDGSAAIDLKGRLGYLEIPQWMLLHEHPLVVGQEFGWNMSFPEQLGPVAAPVRYPEITKVAEGETFATHKLPGWFPIPHANVPHGLRNKE